MLKLAHSVPELDVSQLMKVYSVAPSGAKISDFYEVLLDFFRQTRGFYALWEESGSYCCALRAEPYLDGVLIASLETLPSERRKGYATKLLMAVIGQLQREGIPRIYSHVDKKNTPSIKVHRHCGFERYLDYAVLLDQTVSGNMLTLCKENTADSQ